MTDTAQPSIHIAIPSYSGLFGRDFRASLRGTIDFLTERGFTVSFDDKGGSNLPRVRNRLVDAALESGCKHLMFIDDDMVWQPDMVHNLWKHQYAIVSALTVRKQWPHFSGAVLMGEDGKRTVAPEFKGVIEVDAVGTGFMLINMDVFRKLKRPWFAMPPLREDTEGEDYFFCTNAKNEGYKVWVDCDVQVGHLAQHIVTYQDHLIAEEVEKRGNEGGSVQAPG